jgi:MFS family permease
MPNIYSRFTPQFWLLCLSNFLFCASFQIIIPDLPEHLSNMGGQEQIGYIIALFTLTAGISRPFSGKLTDSIGRVPLMVFGSLVCFVCSGIYPFVHTVAGFLLLRTIHGFSTGTKPTATTAYVADSVDQNRQGEAQGMLGIFTAIGSSIGPSLGSFLTNGFSINVMFYASSIFALLSILILFNLKETLPKAQKQPFSSKLFKLEWKDVFEPKVFSAFLVMLLISFAIGALLTLIPDQTKLLGSNNKGIFFTTLTISSLVVRLLFSKFSDKYGRLPILIFSTALLVTSMVMIAFVQTIEQMVFVAAIYGISWGFNTPTLMAWTVDLSDKNFRGRAIATTYIALEIGIGLGALISGYLYKGVASNMAVSYFIGAGLAFLALVYLVFYYQKQKILNSLNC